MSYDYYGLTEYNKDINEYNYYDFKNYNTLISKYHSEKSPFKSLKDYPHVLEYSSKSSLFTNQIIETNNGYELMLNKVDIKLLNYKEYEDLFNRLIQETLNQDTLKMFKKYQTLKHITN